MKKTILYAAAFVAAVASCNKPEIDAPVAEEKVWVEFTTGAMTKVTREDVEGDADIKHKFVWEENDAITINGKTFTTTESGDKVTFGAEVPVSFLDATSFEAIYPASAGESFEAITVPATYEAVPESGFYGIVAVAASENQSFQFKHATSIVRFQVPSAVSEVEISADHDLAGVVSVKMGETAAVTVTKGVKTVTLSGNFEAGKDYYIPVLAGEKTNLTVKFDGSVSKTWTSATLNQGRVANMGVLPEPTTPVYMRPSNDWATNAESFGAYVWNDDDINWFQMTDSNDDGVYEAEIPVKYPNVIFVAQTAEFVADWKNIYKQTEDLTMPKDDNNAYMIFENAWNTLSYAVSYDEGAIYAEEGYVYLKPNSNWTQSNARFAIYLCNGSKNAEWYSMTKVEGTSYYGVKLPDDFNATNYKNIIFCRMNPSSTTNGWTQDTQKWNQSGDLPCSNIVNGKNCCAIKAGQWDCGANVTWSTVTKLN